MAIEAKTDNPDPDNPDPDDAGNDGAGDRAVDTVKEGEGDDAPDDSAGSGSGNDTLEVTNNKYVLLESIANHSFPFLTRSGREADAENKLMKTLLNTKFTFESKESIYEDHRSNLKEKIKSEENAVVNATKAAAEEKAEEKAAVNVTKAKDAAVKAVIIEAVIAVNALVNNDAKAVTTKLEQLEQLEQLGQQQNAVEASAAANAVVNATKAAAEEKAEEKAAVNVTKAKDAAVKAVIIEAVIAVNALVNNDAKAVTTKLEQLEQLEQLGQQQNAVEASAAANAVVNATKAAAIIEAEKAVNTAVGTAKDTALEAVMTALNGTELGAVMTELDGKPQNLVEAVNVAVKAESEEEKKVKAAVDVLAKTIIELKRVRTVISKYDWNTMENILNKKNHDAYDSWKSAENKTLLSLVETFIENNLDVEELSGDAESPGSAGTESPGDEKPLPSPNDDGAEADASDRSVAARTGVAPFPPPKPGGGSKKNVSRKRRNTKNNANVKTKK